MARPSRRRGSGEEIRGALSRLRSGEVDSLYLLHGPETFLRDEIVGEIRRAVLGDEGSDFNHDLFTWGETPARDIAAAAQTLPFMGGRRLIEVRGLGQVADHDTEILSPLIDDPPPEAVVVFTVERADMRRSFFKKLAGAGAALKLEPPPERELPKWAQSQAEGLGFTLTREAAMLLTEWIEPSLGRIRSELEKLAAYLEPEKTAGVEDVRNLVGRSRAESMYKLGDMLAEGRAELALALVGDLSATDGGPQFLVGFLRNQIRRWTIARAAERKGIRQKELAELLGVPPFVAGRIQQQAGKASPRFLRNLYGKLLAVDRRVKRSGGNAAALRAIELFVIEMNRDSTGFNRQTQNRVPGRPPTWARG